MRIRQLFEAPIADLEYVGDVPEKDSKYGVFSVKADDHAIITTPKGVMKIMNAFERTPYVFNFYVAPVKNKGMNIQLKDIEKLLGRKIETEGRITVIYTNNVTGSYRMPMTAWTLAHRMIHAIQVSTEVVRVVDTVCWNSIVDIWNMVRGRQAPEVRAHGSGGWLSLATHADTLTKFANIIFTMRSARKGFMQVDLDVGGEVLAQYLLTGRVRLVRSEDWQIGRAELYDPNTYIFKSAFINPKRDHTAVNRLIEQAEKDLNEACEKQLASMVGKVLKF